MTPRRSMAALAAFACCLAAGAASAQNGPLSVGLPVEPKLRSLHCAAAIFGELYKIDEGGYASPFSSGDLAAAARTWTEDAASREGKAPAEFIQTDVFAAVSESKLDQDSRRQAQVRWCMARTPPG